MSKKGGLSILAIWLLSGINILIFAGTKIGLVSTGFKGGYGSASWFGYLVNILIVLVMLYISIASGIKKDISPVVIAIILSVFVLLFAFCIKFENGLGMFVLFIPLVILINPIYTLIAPASDFVILMWLTILIVSIIASNLIAFYIKRNKDKKIVNQID